MPRSARLDIPVLILGLLWGSFDYFGFIRHAKNMPLGFAVPFFTLHLIPFWGSILNMVRLFLVHGKHAMHLRINA